MPPGAQLTRLEIVNWAAWHGNEPSSLPLRPSAVAGCTQLAGLEELTVALSTVSSRVDAALAAVLEQAPRLQGVTVLEAEPVQVGYMGLPTVQCM